MHLEHAVAVKAEIDHNLYTWAINEIDDGGAPLTSDQIPWPWTAFFVGTSCEAGAGIEIDSVGKLGQEGPVIPTVIPREAIRVNLVSNETTFSMFGTSRPIREIELQIIPLTDPSEHADCTVWGCPSYTTEVDFRESRTEDCIVFTMTVRPDLFRRYLNLVLMGLTEEVTFSVKGVSGFYSEWSSSIGTDSIKVLTSEIDQVVDIAAIPNLHPPRLGTVSRANVQFKRKLTFTPPAAP